MKKAVLPLVACGILGSAGCTSPSVALDEQTLQELQQYRDSAPRRMEAKLAEWKPDPATEALTPITRKMLMDVLHPQTDIEGDWLMSFGRDGSSLAIRKKENGPYTVYSATGGCLDDWELTRTGTYCDGVLSLNKPVEEYCGWTYMTLYAVSVYGEECLVPQPGILHLPIDHPKDAQVDWMESVRNHAFHRRKERRPPSDGSDAATSGEGDRAGAE